MGVHVIKMPDLGEGIAELEVVAWHVKPGDSIVEDQPLADVMTDKATVEIPSPVTGRVISLGGQVGDTLAVGSEMVRIAVGTSEEETAVESPGAGSIAASGKSASSTPAPAPTPASSTTVVPREGPTKERGPSALPVPAAETAAQTPSGLDKPLASPSVRRQARDLGIQLQLVPGTGRGGRVTHEDVLAFSLRQESPSGSRPAVSGARNEDVSEIPIIGLRRKIAQKMQDAKRRIPHFSYVEEVDVTELEGLRGQLNKRWASERGHLTPLPLLAKAITVAVREFPQVNGRFDDDKGILTRYGAVHLGIATQTEPGLMVPVVHHAESLDLWSIAREISRLAEAARSGKATREELSGSTITISSLGPLGGIVTTPVINYPEVAIVGVNRIVERPMIRGGLVVPRLMMNLSSSFDHRVVDGAVAAQFIQSIRAGLECPATLFID